MRKLLFAAIAVGLTVAPAAVANASGSDGSRSTWACVASDHVNEGACLTNPLPPRLPDAELPALVAPAPPSV